MADIHIGIGGNIGVGKTEFIRQALKPENKKILLEVLKDTFKYDPSRNFSSEDFNEEEYVTLVEEVPDDRILEEYYKDSKRNAFAAQLYFFNLRLNNQEKISRTPGIVFEDRTLMEDKEVFGKTNYQLGSMNDMEWNVYSRYYFPRFTKQIPPPNLWVYLRVPEVDTIMHRINKRGRESEKNIDKNYLIKLNENYELFCKLCKTPYLVIDVSEDRSKRGDEFYREKFQAIADTLRAIRSGWHFDGSGVLRLPGMQNGLNRRE